MPVILASKDEIELWKTSPRQEALWLQRPLPDNALKVVALGAKTEGLRNRRRRR